MCSHKSRLLAWFEVLQISTSIQISIPVMTNFTYITNNLNTGTFVSDNRMVKSHDWCDHSRPMVTWMAILTPDTLVWYSDAILFFKLYPPLPCSAHLPWLVWLSCLPALPHLFCFPIFDLFHFRQSSKRDGILPGIQTTNLLVWYMMT